MQLPYAESTGETNDHYFSYSIGAPNPENGSHVPLFLICWAGFLTNGSFFDQYEFSQDCFSVDLFTYKAFVQFQEYAVYLKQVDDALNGDRDVTLTVRETCWPSWN
ncbi:MAG: hypothetical protein J0M33_22270 [Anaerolineae bacterium]|nr:hypothetical protein [Anaerolineae bacterium]